MPRETLTEMPAEPLLAAVEREFAGTRERQAAPDESWPRYG